MMRIFCYIVMMPFLLVRGLEQCEFIATISNPNVIVDCNTLQRCSSGVGACSVAQCEETTKSCGLWKYRNYSSFMECFQDKNLIPDFCSLLCAPADVFEADYYVNCESYTGAPTLFGEPAVREDLWWCGVPPPLVEIDSKAIVVVSASVMLAGGVALLIAGAYGVSYFMKKTKTPEDTWAASYFDEGDIPIGVRPALGRNISAQVSSPNLEVEGAVSGTPTGSSPIARVGFTTGTIGPEYIKF